MKGAIAFLSVNRFTRDNFCRQEEERKTRDRKQPAEDTTISALQAPQGFVSSPYPHLGPSCFSLYDAKMTVMEFFSFLGALPLREITHLQPLDNIYQAALCWELRRIWSSGKGICVWNFRGYLSAVSQWRHGMRDWRKETLI